MANICIVTLKEQLNSKIIKLKFLSYLKKCRMFQDGIGELRVIEVQLPTITKHHIKKALKIIKKYNINNIIIQDCIKEYMTTHKIYVDANILTGNQLKKIVGTVAIKKAIKRLNKRLTDASILLVVDSFFENNYYINIEEIINTLAKVCSDIIVLTDDEQEFEAIEDFIIDSTGICPICTSDYDVAKECGFDAIINASSSSISYKNDDGLDKKLSIFDLSYKNSFYIIPPEVYKNYIFKKKYYQELTEGLFMSLNPDIDLYNIDNIHRQFNNDEIVRRFSCQGFNVKIEVN